MVAATKKKRGRPRTLNKIAVSVFDDDNTYRTQCNLTYMSIGYGYIRDHYSAEIEQIFTNRKKFFYQGVLEQIGRFIEDEVFTDIDIADAANIAVREIQNGRRSKDIENELRQTRITVKRERGKA